MAKLPNFSQLKWTSSNPKEEFKSFTKVIVTQDGFVNKPHQYLNDLNSWTYGVFSFFFKNNFQPLPAVFTPPGHGFCFPELMMDIDFLKKPGIMEIIWRTSTIVHHTTKPPPDIINNNKITHFGWSSQINHKLVNVGDKFLKITPTQVN
ncbi:hypothetical protein O181_108595 [Austropuccinia psidii MF-1]|uniref:Tet-like 2OG-Fe(II) oxygenase domain-containing protein n=1 Tax=Austropuccinia psidii MF-1 TaxID=1389203 RepID=A0A9Q3PPQ8_9BASI|nr:hypothetical protein [Austropuccinia psidii MF-1]